MEPSIINYLENIVSTRVNQKIPLRQGSVEVDPAKASDIIYLYNQVNNKNKRNLRFYLKRNRCYFNGISAFARKVKARSAPVNPYAGLH